MKKAVCLRVEYFKGTTEVVQGVEKDEKNHWDAERGFFKNVGSGNGVYLVKPKLVLFVFAKPKDTDGTVNIHEHEIQIWVDRYFKDRFGRLTKKNLEAITKTMPTTVEIKEETSINGTKYYRVAEKDLNEWFIRSEEEKERSKKKRKK